MEGTGLCDESDDPPGLEVEFSVPEAGDGLVVRDLVERHRFRLGTPGPVSPAPADETRFWFPTDAAVSIRTDRVSFEANTVVCVRDESGAMVAQVDQTGTECLDAGTYSVEVFGPVKTYLQVRGPLEVAVLPTETAVVLDEAATVYVGARSTHDHPAATITTTTDPRDVMRAVSAFSSALKTTSVERSYPTLRGHPPLLEVGEALDVPAGLAPAATGVRLELPPDLRHVYVAAPLAFYLGVELVPGSTPRLVADGRVVHRFDGPLGFEEEMARALKRVFFLDCVVRTEGFYEVALNEREVVESRVDLDVAALYDAPLGDQLSAYFDVPYDAIVDLIPEWKLTTHVAPVPDNVELLPFVANDLAIVRSPTGTEVSDTAVQATAVDDFLRDDVTRSAGTTTPIETFVRPAETDSIEQAWVSDGTPVGASKTTAAAYHNRLSRRPTDGDIGITVVCNDPEMLAESDVVDEVYRSRSELAFDVDVHFDLGRAELRRVLAEPTDFLHYIGHIDDDGFRCADGKVDAETLDHVGTDAFLLNACQSYAQGLALVDAGAIGGIVTLSDVVNGQAVEVGRTLARLLNGGFPLQASLDVVRDDGDAAHQYAVVGDGSLSVVQAESGVAVLCAVESAGDGTYRLSYNAYPTSQCGPGSLIIPALPDVDQYYLSSSRLSDVELTERELRDFLALEQIPVVFDGTVYWDDGFLP